MTSPSELARLPMTPEQERLWYLERMRPGLPVFNLLFGVRLLGPLDRAALTLSLVDVVRRHQPLRLCFPDHEGQPTARLLERISLTLPSVDLTSATSPDEELRRLVRSEAQTPFDLARGPLFRLLLVHLPDGQHVLLVVAHHLIWDLQSFGIFVEELACCYEARTAGPAENGPRSGLRLPPPATTWLDVVRSRAQRHAEAEGRKPSGLSGAQEIEERRRFWIEHLAPAAGPLHLPHDQERRYPSDQRGDTHCFSLESSLAERLRSFGRAEGCTPAVILLAAFQGLLHACSGQDRFLLGMPVLDRAERGSERLIGFFARPVLLRCDLSDSASGKCSFRDLIQQARAESVAALQQTSLPFADLASSPPQALFSFLPLAQARTQAGDLVLEPVQLDRGMAEFDLFLWLVQTGPDIHGVLEYSSALFTRDTIATLTDAYREQLAFFLDHPEAELARAPLPGRLRRRCEPMTSAPGPTGAREPAAPLHTITLAATFTVEPIEQCVHFWMDRLQCPFAVRSAPYNQVFQQLLSPDSLLGRNQGDINVLLLRFEDWLGPVATEAPTTTLGKSLADFTTALRAALARTEATWIVGVCPPSPRSAEDETLQEHFRRLEMDLRAGLADQAALHFLSAERLHELYPIVDLHDEYGAEHAHLPYTGAGCAALGSWIARTIRSLVQPPFKVIVVDADQCLWQGVVGEEGSAGVVLTSGCQFLQEFLVEQTRQGRLVCLCSKNEERDVLDTLRQRGDMPLRPEHLAGWKINWEPKWRNLSELSRELNLGLDSFVFLDDSPLECAAVRSACPEVLVLQVPAEEAIPSFLRHVWALDPTPATRADRERTHQYQQQGQREQFRNQTTSLAEFLAGLELRIDLAPLAEENLERAAQLTQRTNQFNLTTQRFSVAQLQTFLRQPAWGAAQVSVRDRFGDYGMVGLILYRPGDREVVVETLLLSCRALGRGVEHAMAAWLGLKAQEMGLEAVSLRLVRSGRNQPAERSCKRWVCRRTRTRARRRNGSCGWTPGRLPWSGSTQPSSSPPSLSCRPRGHRLLSRLLCLSTWLPWPRFPPACPARRPSGTLCQGQEASWPVRSSPRSSSMRNPSEKWKSGWPRCGVRSCGCRESVGRTISFPWAAAPFRWCRCCRAFRPR